ncbi:MAG TPA: TolC family protein [Verrucomicrobiae bacterium]|jgi:outer membrane protein, heavy metal efflux system|nr:TolC family protein [Verrucomicrobiae bacterium]
MRKLSIIFFFCFVPWRLSSALPAENSARPTLTLSQAAKEALENNPEVSTMRERLRVMEAKAKQASYLEDPELVLQTMGVPFSNPVNFEKADNNTFGIRQKFPFFGKLGLKEKIAAQESGMAAAQLRAKEREIIAKVKTAYAELFMARKSVEILREQLQIIRSISDATGVRYQVGKVTQQDVLKAQLEQSQVMTQLAVAEEEAIGMEARLNALLARATAAPFDLPLELDISVASLNPDALEQTALAYRPELAEAERGLERAQGMYELAEKNRKYPDFMLGWDYVRMPTEMTKNRYGAMASVTIPFSPWTIGRRNEEVAEALAEIRAAKANREAVRNMTRMEIREAAAKVRAARQSLELYRQGLLSQADLSLSASLSAYQNNRVEFSSVLEAQRSLRETRMAYYRAQVSFVQGVADLERAVGKETSE